MMMKKLLPSVLSLCVLAVLSSCSKEGGGSNDSDAAGAAATAGKGGGPTYALVTNVSDPWWLACKSGINKAGVDLGVNVLFVMPNGEASDQKAKVEDLLSQGVQGIAISPTDPSNQTRLLNSVAAKIPLITQDSDAPESDRRCFIGVDNYEAGRMCGALVEEAIPDGGKVAIFVADLAKHNAIRRRQGVIDELLGRDYDSERFDKPGTVLEGNGYQILLTALDDADNGRAKANVEDAYVSNPDIACYVGLYAYNAPAILEALKSADMLGKAKIVSFDEAPATLAGIKAGTVHGTVVQNPYEYGYQSITMLHKLHMGEDAGIPDNQFVKIEARQIRADNVEEFEIDMKKKQSGE